MGYICRRVEAYPKTGSTWSTVATVLTEASDIDVRKGIGSIKNTFGFKLANADQYFASATNVIKNETLIKIFIWRDSTTYTDADMQIQGTIGTINQSSDDSGDVVVVQGNDFSEVFFDNRIPVNQRNKTWVEMVQEILNQLRDFSGKEILWDDANNPTTKNSGTAFPTKTLILNYTAVSELLDKLTGNEFTDDGQYIYWIEQVAGTFYLEVRYKSQTASGLITQGAESYEIKLNKAKDDVKNFVIYNCGNDLRGNAIEGVKYDTTSIGAIGYKTYYATEETQNLFTSSWNTERNRPDIATTVFALDAQGNPTLDFPTPASYTFIDGTAVTTADGFNTHLTDMALAQGQQIAAGLIAQAANPRYELEHNSRFTNNYTPGQMWTCNFPIRQLNRGLRIMEMKQSVTETSLSLKEDETTATTA